MTGPGAPGSATAGSLEGAEVLFYDGICGLCNQLVQFLLKRDQKDVLRFAALQSDFAVKVLQRHGLDPKDLDTVQVILNYEQPDERVLDIDLIDINRALSEIERRLESGE